MRGQIDWGGTTEVLTGNFATLVGAQALEDRVPSSTANRAAEVNKRAMLTAGGAGLAGVGLVLLDLLGGKRWAGNLGVGLLAGATGLGGQLGMAYVDEKLGLQDPQPSPRGFQPPVTVSTPFVAAPVAPTRLATGADWTNALGAS